MRSFQNVCRLLTVLALIVCLCFGACFAAAAPAISVKDGKVAVTYDAATQSQVGKLSYQLIDRHFTVVETAERQGAEWITSCGVNGEYKAYVYYADKDGFICKVESDWFTVTELADAPAKTEEEPVEEPVTEEEEPAKEPVTEEEEPAEEPVTEEEEPAEEPVAEEEEPVEEPAAEEEAPVEEPVAEDEEPVEEPVTEEEEPVEDPAAEEEEPAAEPTPAGTPAPVQLAVADPNEETSSLLTLATMAPTAVPVATAEDGAQNDGELVLQELEETDEAYLVVNWMDKGDNGPYRVLFKRVNKDGTTDHQVGWFYEETRKSITLNELEPGGTYRIELRDKNNVTCDTRDYTMKKAEAYKGISNLKIKWSKMFTRSRMLDEPKASELTSTYNSTPYALRCKFTFDGLRKADTFSMLCVVTAPNGFEYAHQENVAFKPGQNWTTWQWDAEYMLEVMVKEFGKVPSGDYTVRCYHDGESMGKQTFKVK